MAWTKKKSGNEYAYVTTVLHKLEYLLVCMTSKNMSKRRQVVI